MNIDTENQRQLLHDGSSPITTAAEDLTSNFALSIPQDRADEDDASVHEEGSLSASIGDDDYYDEKISFGDDDEDDIDIRNVIKRLHSEDTTTTQSTSDRDYSKRNLPDDTFSFLIYSDVRSPFFSCGIMVFLFQMAIYVVLANDIINVDNKKNPVGFPFNVSIPVRISEVLAILISIITQHDVRKAICLYRDGFDKGKEGTSTMDKSIAQVFPGATLWKWTLSIVLRASQGFLGLVITFLLIMRSNSVLDLLLNFSAIEFVSTLDDVVFGLAQDGLLGDVLKKEAKDMPEKSYRVSKECLNTVYAMKVSLLYFVVLFLSFFGSWVYIYWQQRSGAYLCQQIFSQFGDEILPMLGTLTGLFYKHEEMKFGGRSSYRDDQQGGPLLAYCKSETRWTLSLTKDVDTDEFLSMDKWDPCNWLAASSESESYSILSTTSSPWVIKTPTNRAAPLTHHFLMCYECTHVANFCGEYGSCVKPGKKYDQCICNKEEGRYGLRCEYSEPCQVVEAEGFSKEGGGLFTSKYYRLEDAGGSHVDT